MADAGVAEKKFSEFFHNNYGPFFNVVLSIILFVTLGIAVDGAADYGYSDDNHNDEYYNIPSGPKGSGVFPLTFLLMLISCGFYFAKVAFFFYGDSKTD